MSGIRVNEWLHNSGTGGIWQTSAGNVGIASSVPTTKLEVTGDAKISGVSTAAAFIPAAGQLSHRNLIINGAMQVAQRGTVTSVTTSSYGGPDRWKAARADAPGTWQLSQVADGPAGFSHCLEHKVTTANGTLDAGDEGCITYSFEGKDLTQVKKGTASAEQLTLSFWCRTNLSGTYIAELYDTDNNRQVSKSFTHAGGDAWEKEEITFPADTTGAFTYDNNESLAVRIWYAAGTTWTSGTLNTTWASSTDANRAVGCTNLSATLNNYFRLTGVQLEVGSVATPFEHRSYGDELLRCQRYYWRKIGTQWAHAAFGLMASTTQVRAFVQFPVTMRAAPTLSGSGMYVDSETTGTFDITAFTSTYLYNSGGQARMTTDTASFGAGTAVNIGLESTTAYFAGDAEF